MKLHTISALALSIGLVSVPALAEVNTTQEEVKVTHANYNQAEFSKYANVMVTFGADKNLFHMQKLADTGPTAPVVRMNQDSVYSMAVVRADENGLVRVSIDPFEGEKGTKDVYTSVHVLDEDSASPMYKVGPGKYETKVNTDWALIIFRSGVEDKSDLTDPLAQQSRFHVDYSATERLSPEGYQPTVYNKESHQQLTDQLRAEFLEAGNDFLYVGSMDDVKDEETMLRTMQSNAMGWGGMPVVQGESNIYRNTAQFDGSQCQQVTFEEPNNLYFSSITLYDETGYMLEVDDVSISSYEWDKNKDGTVTVSFGCGDDAPNNLDTGGMDYNYTFRNYGVTEEVVYDQFGGRQLKYLSGGKINPEYAGE